MGPDTTTLEAPVRDQRCANEEPLGSCTWAGRETMQFGQHLRERDRLQRHPYAETPVAIEVFRLSVFPC